uniref:Uncharacterized protein n=1 Tax=Anguilla anguilla TaxID=7936 RepID=A0A0E9RR23_ANGAN
MAGCSLCSSHTLPPGNRSARLHPTDQQRLNCTAEGSGRLIVPLLSPVPLSPRDVSPSCFNWCGSVSTPCAASPAAPTLHPASLPTGTLHPLPSPVTLPNRTTMLAGR